MADSTMTHTAQILDQENVEQSAKKPPFDLDVFLNKHLRFTKKRVKYHREELDTLCMMAQLELQKNSSALIEIPYLPIYIIGDIHGQWRDLLRIFSTLGLPGKARYLFLGDYVDRGKRSLESICLLLALKLRYPEKIYLLRGNHECDYINYSYGFHGEIRQRFNLGDTMVIFKGFNHLFTYLPLSALIVKRVLCMHGGISPKLTSLNALRRIRVPTKVEPSDHLPLDLLWSDPRFGKGFVPNAARDCSYAFGADTVIKMCEKLGLDLIVRAHQALPLGFGFFARRKLATIFSAPGYLMPETNSFGAVIKISMSYELSIVIFNPATKESMGKFVETFEQHRTGRPAEDEITKIIKEEEKMPSTVVTTSQMGSIPTK